MEYRTHVEMSMAAPPPPRLTVPVVSVGTPSGFLKQVDGQGAGGQAGRLGGNQWQAV